MQIIKDQLAKELKLPLRDLRIIDVSFPNQMQTSLTARPTAILLSLERIKIVIKSNEALVFDIEKPETSEFLSYLQQQKTLLDSGEGDINSKNFELWILESALHVMCSNLFKQVNEITPAVTTALRHLQAESRGIGVLETQMDALLPLKNRLDELKMRIRDIKRAIDDVLEDDDHMIMINSLQSLEKPKSELPRNELEADTSTDELPSGDGINVEMLLENYLMQLDWIEADVDDQIDEVRNTEENVILQLDLLRNRFLKFELMLSLSSIIISSGALVTGIYGMNLKNGFELSLPAFRFVTSSIILGMCVAFLAAATFGKRHKLF